MVTNTIKTNKGEVSVFYTNSFDIENYKILGQSNQMGLIMGLNYNPMSIPGC